MDLISYGDGIPEGDYRLHSAFANAINFRRGRVLVSLVPPRAGAGPLNVVLSQLPPGARRLRSTRFYFYIDENRLRKEPEARYASGVPATDAPPEAVQAGVEALARILALSSPAKSLAFAFDPAREKDFTRVFERQLLARFKKGLGYFAARDYARGVKTMRGLGLGLTPSGDDFISGLLAGFNFAMRSLRFDAADRIEKIYFYAEGGNLVSSAFIRCSYEGRVNEAVRELLLALGGGGRRLEAAARRALASGHTSGADFCSGVVFALRDVFSA
jgi:hypothetical protein